MFRTIVMDKPLIKRHGKFERIESYPDMELFWNEPFETLNLLKLEEDIKEYDKKIKGIPTPKTKAGTPGGI